MKEKRKFGFTSQGYIAPRAEYVAIAQESILCASITPKQLDGQNENFGLKDIGGW